MGLSAKGGTSVAVEHGKEERFFIRERGADVRVLHVQSPPCVPREIPHMLLTA
jgi:hypothetical protein